MKVVICDEDRTAAAAAQSILQKIAVRRGMDLQVLCMATAAECYAYLLTDKADLVILETEIAGASGIELAKRLRENLGRAFALIFLTGSNEYAAESYEVDAAYYLLKPCEEKKMLLALERAHIFEKEKTIAVFDGKNILRLNKSDIIAVEVLNKNCRIYTAEQEYEVHTALSRLKQVLPSTYFWHVHRSYIVNIEHIEKQEDYDFYMTNGIRIPIRRSQFSEIKADYIQWMLHKI